MAICSTCSYESHSMEFEAAAAAEDDRHPSQSRIERYPIDDLLRKAKFVIHMRPRVGEPIWKRLRRTESGSWVWVLVPQAQALRIQQRQG